MKKNISQAEVLSSCMYNNSPGLRIAVIGAGNGGQALAGTLASRGHEVRLFSRSLSNLGYLLNSYTINCFGAELCNGKISCLTDNLEEAITECKIIFVVTTANAHKNFATLFKDYLEDDQIIILSPGRTGGALEFREVLKGCGCSARVYVAEAQSLLYACRIAEPGSVHLIGVKSYVPVAAYPTQDTKTVVSTLKQLHSSFTAAENVLQTGFLNMGAVFHPVVVLFNAAAIERGSEFFFYQDMTPSVAEVILKLDQERLALGEAYGIKLLSVMDWMSKAYPDSSGNTLCERIKFNPAYYEIKSPEQLASRYLTESIPTGLVPFVAFGEVAGLKMPLMRSIIHMGSALLGRDFMQEGRTLAKMGLEGKSLSDIIKLME